MFYGLTQKEKESKIESFSFSFILLSLLNNLLWLAYAHKIGDQNLAIPNFLGKYSILTRLTFGILFVVLGTSVAILLTMLYLSVSRNQNQLIAALCLVSIA